MRPICHLLVIPLLAAGCASKRFNEPGELSVSRRDTDRMFSGSYAAVWEAALAALREKKYPLASAQRDGGLIVTDWILGKSDRLFSGYGETRIPYNIRSKFTIRLRPSKEGVAVSVANEEQYYSDAVTSGSDFSGSLYQWLPAQSSTVKEASLLAEIDAQMAAAKGAKPKK